jgi:hypothetical protein
MVDELNVEETADRKIWGVSFYALMTIKSLYIYTLECPSPDPVFTSGLITDSLPPRSGPYSPVD